MSKPSNKNDRFEYYEENCSCEYCLFSQHKPRGRERGCDRDTCCCEDIRMDVISHGRIKRDRRWDKKKAQSPPLGCCVFL